MSLESGAIAKEMLVPIGRELSEGHMQIAMVDNIKIEQATYYETN